MDTIQLPPFRPVLITSIILFGIGTVGLTLIFLLTLPTLGPRWLLYFLTPFLVCGLVLPFTWLLNRRLAHRFPPSGSILVREIVFFGIYVDLIIWLQFGEVLNFALAVFLLAGIILIEILLRWWERNRFNAGQEE
jgi:Flp pilus assembly protein protease CpaA